MRRLAALALGAMLLGGCAGPPQPPSNGGSPAAGAAGSAAAAAAAGAGVSPTAAVPTLPVPEGRVYPAPDDQPVQVRAAWCAVTGAQFPLWLAKESGVLARHRIEADLTMIQGSSAAISTSWSARAAPSPPA